LHVAPCKVDARFQLVIALQHGPAHITQWLTCPHR
jgi:hypothetical protein